MDMMIWIGLFITGVTLSFSVQCWLESWKDRMNDRDHLKFRNVRKLEKQKEIDTYVMSPQATLKGFEKKQKELGDLKEFKMPDFSTYTPKPHQWRA